MASQVRRMTEDAFFKAPRTFGARFPNGFPIGKRTERRAKENAQLNKLKITWCELQLKGCLGTHHLTWAHSQKSRYLITSRDWQEAARACLSCHDQVEAMSHQYMKRVIKEAIARRP